MMLNKRIRVENTGLYDLGPDALDDDLKQAVLRCIESQMLAASEQIHAFVADPTALEKVSESALAATLEQKRNVHGIASDRSISNVISFGAAHIEGAVIDDGVKKERLEVDRRMGLKLEDLFDTVRPLSVTSSGHFWYPKGSYMSWHTNSKVPGWRIYINYAEEEGRSFFRYQDPHSGNICTLNDKHWNVRVFRIMADQPFWHCVYSDTNRFSLGYMIKPDTPHRSMLTRIRKKLKL